jgi:hypothetical protein
MGRSGRLSNETSPSVVAIVGIEAEAHCLQNLALESEAMSEQIETEEVGSLGVAHLEKLWSRWTHRVPAVRDKSFQEREWARDRTLIHGLGIGLEQIARFLSRQPAFEELEAWILELNGGSIAPSRIARLNAALSDTPYDLATANWLDDVAAAPPVLDQSDLDSWTENGLVVLHDAISPEECAAAAQAVQEFIGAHPDDPETWYWRPNCQGIMVQFFQHPALEPARGSARIHKAFSQLLGSVDLLPTTDRCGWNPPERADFAFPGPRLHWDADLTAPIDLGVQGILYLADTTADQGAFSCIPGFHKSIDSWLRSLPPGAGPQERIAQEAAQAIAGKAGDLIMWHQALPHGSSPNRAVRPRIVQYITMFPARP